MSTEVAPLTEPALEEASRASRDAIARVRSLVARLHEVHIREEMLLKAVSAGSERLAERGGFEPPVEL